MQHKRKVSGVRFSKKSDIWDANTAPTGLTAALTNGDEIRPPVQRLVSLDTPVHSTEDVQKLFRSAVPPTINTLVSALESADKWRDRIYAAQVILMYAVGRPPVAGLDKATATATWESLINEMSTAGSKSMTVKTRDGKMQTTKEVKVRYIVPKVRKKHDNEES